MKNFQIRFYNFYAFYAFLTNRRKQLWLDLNLGISGKIWFAIFKLFFSKNMIEVLEENEAKIKIRNSIFLFRNPKNAEKFKQAQKLSWKESEEKHRLYGEALGYPKFAVSDFLELLEERKKDNNEEVKAGDRLAFSSFNYGYGGFIFKPENLSKIINWSKEQKIPQKDIKIKIYNFQIGRFQSLSKNEIKELLESRNPLKTSEKNSKK